MKPKIHNDLNQKFGKGTIVIHWVTALLIIVLFPMGKYMTGLEPADKEGIIKIHAILGIVIFLLTILRSWFFFKSPRPANLKTGSKFNDKLTVWVHNSFYILLLGISVSGIATMVSGNYIKALSTGNMELINSSPSLYSLNAHDLIANIIMLLFVMHVVGVLKHYISTKENVIRRIL